MDILTLLEHLANKAHHQVMIDELIITQPSEIKNSFLTNNSSQLKSQLGDTTNLADKKTIFNL